MLKIGKYEIKTIVIEWEKSDNEYKVVIKDIKSGKELYMTYETFEYFLETFIVN